MKSTIYFSLLLLLFLKIGEMECNSFGNSRLPENPSRPTYRESNPSQIYRPFKSIIVTSKPFGLDNNEIERKKTTSTTTTPSPLIKGQPTIPFFSISCTVGSSCSQIISAREVKTPMPTFKPYTKEDIAKFKGPLSLLFPPTNVKTTTTTTTEKPFRKTSNSVWRIRSTTPSTTEKPWVNQQQSDWITFKGSNLQTADLITKKQPSIHKNTAIHSQDRNPETRTESTTLFTWTLAQNSNPTTESPVRKPSFWIQNRPQSIQKIESHPKPSSHEGGWISLLTTTLQHLQNRNPSQKVDQSNLKKPIWNIPKDKLNPPRPESITTWNRNPSGTPSNIYSQSIPSTLIENPSTNKKVSLVTASSTNPVLPKWNIQLPPEVSVSSNVIGLRVKPKSLFGPAHIETIQGVDIETDGEDVNLTDLIMKENLPRPHQRSIHPSYQRPQIDTNLREIRQSAGFNRESDWKPSWIFPRT